MRRSGFCVSAIKPVNEPAFEHVLKFVVAFGQTVLCAGNYDHFLRLVGPIVDLLGAARRQTRIGAAVNEQQWAR